VAAAVCAALLDAIAACRRAAPWSSSPSCLLVALELSDQLGAIAIVALRLVDFELGNQLGATGTTSQLALGRACRARARVRQPFRAIAAEACLKRAPP